MNALTCCLAIPVLAISHIRSRYSFDLAWLQFAFHSSLALQVLSCGIYVNSLAVIPYTALQAGGRADITAKLHIAELLPHLAVLIVSIHLWGINGAAFAWCLRVVVDTALLQWAFVPGYQCPYHDRSSPGDLQCGSRVTCGRNIGGFV